MKRCSMSSGALQIVQSSLTVDMFQVYLRYSSVLITRWVIKKDTSFSRPNHGPSKQEHHIAAHEATLWPRVPQQASALGFTVFCCSRMV